jgi:hypothetical protein
MTERIFNLGVLDDPSGRFGIAATEVLRQCSAAIKTFVVDASTDAWRVDVIVAGTTSVNFFEVKQTAERIREIHGTLPNTLVVFATQSNISAEVVQTVVSAGAISAVTFAALPQTIGNLFSSNVFTSASARNESSFVVEGAHDPNSGRLDAKRIAELFGVPLTTVAHAVGVTPSALSRRRTARSAQDGLRELTFVWRTLMNACGTEAKAKAWLNAARPDLGGKPPLVLLTSGRARDLGNYIRRALAGEPA